MQLGREIGVIEYVEHLYSELSLQFFTPNVLIFEQGEIQVPEHGHAAILLFLKHAALDKEWDTSAIRTTLRVDANTAKEIASELQLMGYSMPVLRKSGFWRNTESGNLISGVRPPRLSRAKAEELLTDLAERAEAYNLKAAAPVRIGKILAFRAFNGKHEKIQDIDLGVQIQPIGEGPISKADHIAAFKELRGRSPALKLHLLEVLSGIKGKVVWEA